MFVCLFSHFTSRKTSEKNFSTIVDRQKVQASIQQPEKNQKERKNITSRHLCIYSTMTEGPVARRTSAGEIEVKDPKVGTVLLGRPTGEDGVPLKKKERRYVYCSMHCQEEPYYLSKTLNRMFVVDKRRIEYFPDGIEPDSIKREMMGWPDNQEALDDDELIELDPEEDVVLPDEKIGTIKVQVGKGGEAMYDPDMADPEKEGVVIREVYCSKLCGGKPYYLTYTDNKIFVVDRSRIILDNPPPAKRRKRPVYI